jgi:hypothetical protein
MRDIHSRVDNDDKCEMSTLSHCIETVIRLCHSWLAPPIPGWRAWGSTMVTPLIREYAAQKGMLAFRNSDDARDYGKAAERFVDDGNRAAYMEALLALGVAPALIRWHVANPGG